MTEITSRTNPRLVHIRKLAGSAGLRRSSGTFLCDSPKLLSEAIQAGWELVQVVSTHEVTLPPLPAGTEEIRVPRDVMESISHMKTPQGVLCICRLPDQTLPQQLTGQRYVVLDGVQDPGNMGTILRIADWFGIRDVVCSEHTADCFNPKVVQATMGAIARVRVYYLSLVEWLSDVLKAGLPIYGTFLDGETIYNVPLAAEGVIVMGSEGKGVSAQVAELVTNRLYIPSFPVGVDTSESLNVATATAIVCSEFRRRCL